MTASDIIQSCQEFKEEFGIIALLDLLESITMCQAQAAGVDFSDLDEDPDAGFYTVTLQ